MDVNNNVKENNENINGNFEFDLNMKKLREDLKKRFLDYQMTMKYMLADAPIAVLCLPPKSEKILLDNGLLRIYDLFNTDLLEIKGLGESRVRDVTTCLDKFFSMLQ